MTKLTLIQKNCKPSTHKASSRSQPKELATFAGHGFDICPATKSVPKSSSEFDRRVRACLIQAIEKDQTGSVIIKINHSQESEAVSSWKRLKRSDPLLILRWVRSVSILNDNFSDDQFMVIYLKRGGSNA